MERLPPEVEANPHLWWPAAPFTLTDSVTDSPLHSHTSSPRELGERIAAERSGGAFLLYRDGDGAQVILPLDEVEDRITIGRRPSNEVALDWDSEVSRVHAALERTGEEWTVVDDGLSHNGTFVAGERVTARRRLRDGDVIAIGTHDDRVLRALAELDLDGDRHLGRPARGGAAHARRSGAC